jgi:hypothetical protein
MKSLLRFVVGYAVGVLLVGSWLLSRGDAFESVARLLASWLPIAVVYGAIAATILRLNRLSRLLGMLELCGLCIGLFPLFSGLWPTYSMRWDLALIMVAVQCAALALAVGAVFLSNRFVGSLRKSDGEPPATK